MDYALDISDQKIQAAMKKLDIQAKDLLLK